MGKGLYRRMKKRVTLIFCGLTLLEGVMALVALLGMNFTPGRGGTFNYLLLRSILAGGLILVLAGLAVFIGILLFNQRLADKFSTWLDGELVGTSPRLFFVQGALVVMTVFMGECFFMTYLALPEPLRPVFFLAAILCLQGWVSLRIAYAGEYRARPSLKERLYSKWKGWLPIQRRVAKVMVLLGLVYFIVFIPFNLLKDEYGNFYVQGDEQVLYPDVVRGMVFPHTLEGAARSLLEAWPWQYGYPYFTASAAVLLVPRLIFGEQFAAQVQLNLFLLRQFVNVLPMTIILLLAVYLATRFKNLLISVGGFLFLALVPGLVKFNIRFWHPDGLIVLLVLFTIFVLEKDQLRFRRYFYLAAVFCGLAAILKLWGLFFGPVIAGYLLAGAMTKRVTIGKMLFAGGLFVLVMVAAIILSSPSLMAPYIARVALRGWLPRQGFLLAGYGPDATGEYATGLFNWLKYFGFHYMKGYFFFFSILALGAGSVWGPRAILYRILLGWSAVVTIFLAYFAALKNFQYMLPVAIPLFIGALLLLPRMEEQELPGWPAFMNQPKVHRLIRGIVLVVFASQLVINIVILGLYAIRGG
jgi:hypothetical protein